MAGSKELNRSVQLLLLGIVVAAIGALGIALTPSPYERYLFGFISIGGYFLTWAWVGTLIGDARALLASGRNGALAIQLVTNIRMVVVRLSVWTAILITVLIEHIQHQQAAIDEERLFLLSFLVIIMFASTVLDRRDRERIVAKSHPKTRE